jgi:hypothetical protein
MKRFKKDYLKSIKIGGFKWDNDPINMYKECSTGDGYMNVSKSDLKKLIDMAIFKHNNNLRIIKSLGHQLGF